MPSPYVYKMRITVFNPEGHEDEVFSGEITANDEKELTTGTLKTHWLKAWEMSTERSDDGTDWDVEVSCLSVTDPDNQSTDWENDMMPQRDEVSAWLMVELSNLHP